MNLKNLNWQWTISMLGCIAWWICVGVAICLVLSGCGQRQVKNYKYTITRHLENNEMVIESHEEWEYKSNRIFTFEQIDSVFIDIPSKGKVLVGPYTLNPDDIKAGYGPWWLGSRESLTPPTEPVRAETQADANNGG
jgi:hypothetical protein